MSDKVVHEITPSAITQLSTEFRAFLKRSQHTALMSRLEDQIDSFGLAIDRLSETVNTVTVLQLEADPQSVASALRDIVSKYRKISSGLDYEQLADNKVFREITTEITRSNDSLLEVVRTAWAQLVSNNPPGDYSHLASLASDQLSASENLRFTRLQQKLARLSGVSEPSASQVVSYIEDNENLSQLAGKLKTKDLPSGIAQFVEAVSSGGSPLDLYTQDVLDWMEAAGTMSEYRIVHGD